MQLDCGVEASYTRGRNRYGNQEGGKEVYEEVVDEEEQLEEVELIAQVQSIGKPRC
jgi:hypothetical protein